MPNTTSMSCSTKRTVRFSERAILRISSTADFVSAGEMPGRRLVEEQEARLDRERRRDLERALVAVGQLARADATERRQTHAIEQRGRRARRSPGGCVP